MAIKIEDGDGYERGTWAATVEALRQAGVLDGGALRDLARYHRPTILDPHGRLGAETIAEFELAPVGELIGLDGLATAGRTPRSAATQPEDGWQSNPNRTARWD
jgi:hypothetical protein